MRVRALVCASLVTLLGWHLAIADAVTAPDAPHSAPVAVSGPSRDASDAKLTNALRANLAYQATKDADLAAWYAAASKPAPTHYVKQSGATAVPSDPVAYDPGSVQALICDAFGSACAKALSVAKCESGFDPYATNGHYRGIFQVGDMHAAQWLEVTGRDYWSSWMNAATNIAFARWLWEQDGWGPWSCA